MKMSDMKMPDMKINKSWNGLPSDYKVFIIVAALFFFLSPGMTVEIDEPSDLVRMVTSGGKIDTDEIPMNLLSLLQVMWNYIQFEFKSGTEERKETLKGIRPIIVHSIVAGLIATYLLKA